MKCRHCAEPLTDQFLDLGTAPPSNAYLTADQLGQLEPRFPLRLLVCHQCWLVQTEDFAAAADLFREDYAYFSSVSKTWLDHAKRYAESITSRLGLGKTSFAIEVASNDGYLLRNFVAAGIPCLGIEPTASTAAAAERLGIPVLREFFGRSLGEQLARENKRADLIVGNNVYAHVPDINDFTAGLRAALKPGGTITLEFPHLMRLIEQTQFDTVYHEHYSYLSLQSVVRIFGAAGLKIWDVEELSTHGGSIRVYGCLAEDSRAVCGSVGDILAEEGRRGLRQLDVYRSFQARVDRVKEALVEFLSRQKQEGKSVAAYGAAAKGNTILNYAGIGPDLVSYICDAAPSKQGKFTPGGHIPILAPSILRERRPDIVLILPWNLADEVISQQSCVREWGGKFVVAVPELRVLA